MQRLTKIGVMSAAKIEAIIMLIFGLIIGIIFAIMGQIAESATGMEGFAVFGWGAVIFWPILYGIIGFISGAIGAAIYNVAAGWIGGIEIKLEDVKEKTVKVNIEK